MCAVINKRKRGGWSTRKRGAVQESSGKQLTTTATNKRTEGERELLQGH